jgi:hypothetical protein
MPVFLSFTLEKPRNVTQSVRVRVCGRSYVNFKTNQLNFMKKIMLFRTISRGQQCSDPLT